jgi:putative transcriptional regulator
MAEEILNKVGELRKKKGITQEGFGEAIGVTRQTIIAIEKGNYVPSLMLALHISQFFQLKVEDIFKIK